MEVGLSTSSITVNKLSHV